MVMVQRPHAAAQCVRVHAASASDAFLPSGSSLAHVVAALVLAAIATHWLYSSQFVLIAQAVFSASQLAEVHELQSPACSSALGTVPASSPAAVPPAQSRSKRVTAPLHVSVEGLHAAAQVEHS